MDETLLEVLACPKCKNLVRYENEEGYICDKCLLAYPIRNNIPIMLKDEAIKIKN